MDWSKLNVTLACLAVGYSAHTLLRALDVSSPGLWAVAVSAAAGLLLLSPAVRRRGARVNWAHRLYRLRRNPRLASVFHLPRRPGLLERLYLSVSPPGWCRSDDLMVVYRDRRKLLHEGAVVLAVLVQANSRLFERGADDAPANVIYTTDNDAEQPVVGMLGVAQKLFSLKNTKPEDPDEARFAQIVSNELGRDFRVTVPERLSGGLDLTYTTIMVHRKHLPDGRLVAPYFPLLIHAESRAAMILPARYWPDDFAEGWVKFGEEDDE
ncbi:MAG TPA: hypothetical protein VFZ44_09695 [Pyrinomonadaceae bacterium]